MTITYFGFNSRFRGNSLSVTVLKDGSVELRTHDNYLVQHLYNLDTFNQLVAEGTYVLEPTSVHACSEDGPCSSEGPCFSHDPENFDGFTPHCEADTESAPCTCVVCPACDGHGFITQDDSTGIRHDALCPICDGGGSITRELSRSLAADARRI